MPNFTCGTKHGQKNIYSRPDVKGTSSIRIRPEKLYERTHDNYTKVPRCKTWKNWPMMYTWIVKNAIDVAEGFRVLSLIRNNIFLDKPMNYLLNYLKFIDQIIENHDKSWDRMQKFLKSFVPKVLPQLWMAPYTILLPIRMVALHVRNTMTIPIQHLGKHILKHDKRTRQTHQLHKWIENNDIDRILSHDFWTNLAITYKQKTSLIKFRSGQYMCHIWKQIFFCREAYPS